MLYAIFKVIKWIAHREAETSLIGLVEMNIEAPCLVNNRFDIIILPMDKY